jgi:XTP/dITP diphosphohydrolase
MNIVLASENPGKLKEIQSIFNDWPITLQPQSVFHVPEVEETGLTFVENALIKARHAAKYSGLSALADDSGIIANALNGAPGIYSARYAKKGATSQENIDKLLANMQPFSGLERRVYYYCAIVYVRNEQDPTPLICTARWDGILLNQSQGQGGFGYDPVFFVPELNCSAAELDATTKNKMSHRGKALAQFKSAFEQIYTHDL